MDEEIRELKNERKIEQRELRQNNNKKKGLIAGAVVASVAALGLGLGLGLGLQTPKHEIKLNSTLSTADPTGDGKYEIGDEVIIEAEEIPGYRFDHWEFNGNEITSNPYIFELTEDKIGEYTAVYEEEYTITLSTTENGSVSVVDNKTNAIYEEEVELLVTPNTNYALNKLYYVEEDSETQVTISNLTFQMPANNITIYAEFVELEYTATVSDSIQNGTITLSPNGGIVGTEITVTVTPDEGYELTRLYFTTTSTEFDILEDDGYHFTIPKENVVVYAEFTLKQYTLGTIPSNVTVKRGEETLTSNSIITHGDTLTITYTETEGYSGALFITGAINVENNDKYIVTSNISIEYSETYIQLESEYKNILIFTYSTDGLYTASVKAASTSIDGEIVIPEKINYQGEYYTVNTIEEEAFIDCINISSINIPATIETIGNSAFYNCKGLTEINYNATNAASLLSSNGVFSYAGQSTNGITINIAKNVKNIPDYLFYPNSNNNLIPNIIQVNFENNSQCTSIGSYAFYNCRNLTNVKFSDNIISIEERAFYGCTNLTGIILPSQLSSIGYYSFYECKSLKSISLPDNLRSIETHAFYNCTSLNNVTLSNKLNYIGSYVFYKTPWFTTITNNNKGICTATDNKTKYMLGAPSNITTIDLKDVRVIATFAFYECKNLTSVNLSSSLVNIGVEAFIYCNKLVDINLEECTNLENIGSGAFKYCESLTEITIPSKLRIIHDNLFYGCINLKYINFSDNSKLESIGIAAFHDCTQLIYLDLEKCKNLKNIEAYAFFNCISLIRVILPENLETIESVAFQHCYKLIEIVNLSKLDINKGTSYHGDIALYTLDVYNEKTYESKIKTIDNFVMYEDQDNLIYYCVAYIGNEKKLKFPETENNYEIYQYALYGHKKIEEVYIPNNVVNINRKAFENCISLTEVIIPNGLTSIGIEVFYGCVGLTKITIPNSVTNIGDYAFYNCTSLAGITIPSSVTSIGDYSFYNCTSLTNITIPSNVTYIGSSAFYKCANLKNVIFENYEGWYITNYKLIEGGTYLSSSDLSNSEISATYLTSTYSGKYWKK